jgi:transposase
MMVALILEGEGMGEKKQRRSWTPDEKTEIVLAGLRGDRSVRDVCREHVISETQYDQWRDRLLEAGKAALRRPNEKSPYDAELKEARKRIAQLERALGRKTYDLEVAGKLLRDWE